MLLYERKPKTAKDEIAEDKLLIGDDISVTVVRIGPGEEVELCVEAPKDVPILSKEDYDKKQAIGQYEAPTQEAGQVAAGGLEQTARDYEVRTR